MKTPKVLPLLKQAYTTALYPSVSVKRETTNVVNLNNYRKQKTEKLFSLEKLLGFLSFRERLTDYFVFSPEKKGASLPKENANIYEEVYVDTPDGEKLHGYFMLLKEKTDKVMIYLQGRDENVSRWYLGPKNIQEHVPVNALIVGYRGYGNSSGEPSCKGVVTDALSMYQYLLDKGYKPENISLYGRSLGGAVALELASKVKVRSVVVQSSFSSLRDIMKYSHPFVPAILVNNKIFNSNKRIKEINAPVLICHGTKDDVVPVEHGCKLYNVANEPKKLIILPGAGHRHLKAFFNEEYYKVLRELFC